MPEFYMYLPEKYLFTILGPLPVSYGYIRM